MGIWKVLGKASEFGVGNFFKYIFHTFLINLE